LAQALPAEVIRYADLVLHNGKIITVDRIFSLAQAIAVRDGKILKVGQNADVLALAGPATRRIDLRGRTVVPGLIDTHSHLHEYGLDRHAPTMNPDLLEVRSKGAPKRKCLSVWRSGQEKETRRVADHAHPPAQRRRWFRQQQDALRLGQGYAEQSDHGSRHRHQSDDQQQSAGTTAQALRYFGARVAQEQTGRFTGRIGAGVSPDFLRRNYSQAQAGRLAPVYLKELEDVGAAGVTTWSSSLGSEAISAFHYMDQKDMMPIRLAYTNEAGYRDNIYGESFVNRFRQSDRTTAPSGSG
jgi:predicted amidohydrolase YtcJ